MKIKTSELTGAALDWAVAKCENKGNDIEVHAGNVLYGRVTSGFVHFNPSTDWAQGGPIIEREGITIRFWENETHVHAYKWNTEGWFEGPTPLIAAMRCYVASKLGDEVEVPDELH
jgi:hypothetical protein